MIRLILVLFAVVAFLILSIPILIVEWLIGKKNPKLRDESSLHIVQFMFRLIQWLAGTKVTVIGEENVPKDIPVNSDLDRFIAQPVTVDGKEYAMTCVSMGNPHAIVFLPDVDSLDLEKIGPSFEHHPLFPDRVNTEFVRVIDDHTLQMRVWERGSGETFACGTGTCATVVAAVLNGYCKMEEEILVHLRGGDLRIIYHEDETVTMIGPATYVFEGKMEYPKL